MFFKLDCTNSAKNISYCLSKHPDGVFTSNSRFDASVTQKRFQSIAFFEKEKEYNKLKSYSLFVLPSDVKINYGYNISPDLFFKTCYVDYYNNMDYFVNLHTLKHFCATFKSVLYGRHDPVISDFIFDEKKRWSAIIGPFSKETFLNTASGFNEFKLNLDFLKSNELDFNYNIKYVQNDIIGIKVESKENETLTDFLQKIYLACIAGTIEQYQTKLIENKTIEKYVNLCRNWYHPQSRHNSSIYRLFIGNQTQINKFNKYIKIFKTS